MRSRSTLLLLGAAGLCWTLGQAVLPDMGLQTGQRLDAVSAARGAEAASTAFLIVAGCILVLGAMSVVRVMGRVQSSGARGSGLIGIGAAGIALGGIWLAAGRAAFNMMFLRATGPDVPRDVAITMLDATVGPEFLPLLLTLPALLLGPILLGLGLRRAGLTGWLPVALWVVGIGTFVATEFNVKAGEVAGVAIASLALGLLGRAVGATGPTVEDRRSSSKQAPLAEPAVVS